MEQQKPTLLYVDDVYANLVLFQQTFKKEYDIILTESPHEALEILEKKDIQVIVSDQRMPAMTGTELLEIVAQKYPDISRYLLTAYKDVETVIEGINKGRIHGFIEKPIKANEIRAKINSSLEVYYLKKKNEQILKELEQANTALLDMDGLKSEIINAISSEISPPLNRIMGTLHLLKTKIQGGELTDVVNILDHSVFKLEQLSMLAKQISILKSPGYTLEKHPIPIKQLMQYSSIEAKEELKDLDIDLVIKKDSGDYTLDGDSDLLVSCLINLILFAKEHTAANGKILINSLQSGGELGCQVVDSGSNYSEALFSQLTNQFSTTNSPLNLSMGIGMAVSKIIMEAHGGQLVFEKTEDNKGKMKMVFPNE